MCLGTLAHKCPKHMFFLSFFFFFLFFSFSCCFSLDRPSVVFSLIICAYFTLSLSLSLAQPIQDLYICFVVRSTLLVFFFFIFAVPSRTQTDCSFRQDFASTNTWTTDSDRQAKEEKKHETIVQQITKSIVFALHNSA